MDRDCMAEIFTLQVTMEERQMLEARALTVTAS
jgi:hypothetical protein